MDIVTKILEFLFEIVKIPLAIVGIIVLIFCLSVGANLLILAKKGKRIKQRLGHNAKKPILLKRIFIDAPKQFAIDLVNREPDFFGYQGCIIFCGRQGSGKTISLVQYALELKDKYPKSKIISNLKIKGQDDSLNHWSQLINYKNGINGVIVCMDETQNWFSSSQSRDFPPEMLQVITQNRKNRRIILGTAQSFHLLAKTIRTQCTEVRDCITFAGCLTIVVKRYPEFDSEGNVTKLKYRGMYCYAHSQKLRDAYDTYNVIEALNKSGFVPIDRRPQ